jgi:hypothetical protein
MIKQANSVVNDRVKEDDVIIMSNSISVDACNVSNAILKRLIEEVRY